MLFLLPLCFLWMVTSLCFLWTSVGSQPVPDTGMSRLRKVHPEDPMGVLGENSSEEDKKTSKSAEGLGILPTQIPEGGEAAPATLSPGSSGGVEATLSPGNSGGDPTTAAPEGPANDQTLSPGNPGSGDGPQASPPGTTSDMTTRKQASKNVNQNKVVIKGFKFKLG